MQRITAIALAVAAVAVGCVRDHGPVELGCGLHSRRSSDETRRALAERGKDWRVVEHKAIKSTTSRPGFDAQVVSAGEYVDLGTSGELRLLFFNGQLVTTWFYPSDVASYRAQLERQRKLVFRPSGAVAEADGLGVKIWIGKDAGGKDVVGFTDVYLDEGRLSWLGSYADIMNPQSLGGTA